MTNSAATLVINNRDHPHIFPAVLCVLFGTILLYNVYGLISHSFRMKKLSLAEEMIIKGHKKLIENREQILIEGGGVLDENFLYNEIMANEESLAGMGSGELAKRRKKAEARQKKRIEAQAKQQRREEKRRLAAEARAAKKLTPTQLRKKQAEEIEEYEATYNSLITSANLRIEKAQKILAQLDDKDVKHMDRLTAEFGNKEQKKRLEERLATEAKADKKRKKKKTRAAIKKAQEQADIDLFGTKTEANG